MRRTLLNLLLRALVKPVWRHAPSIELLRRRAAMIDRHFGGVAPSERTHAEQLSDDVSAQWIGPRERQQDGAILYLHGGAFCVHLPATYRAFCADLARRTQVPVLLPDYRLAPEHPAPAALDDCELAYRWLLQDVPAERIVLAGDSAGGNLALALLQRCRPAGLPMPAGAVLLSPMTDFSGEGWSMHFNEKRDVMFTLEALDTVVGHYLPRVLADDPQVSPLRGDWSGLPPLRFHVSSSEMLLDHSLRAVERAQLAGVDAQAAVWLNLPHVFPLFELLREANQCRGDLAAFVAEVLATPRPTIDGKRIVTMEPHCDSTAMPRAEQTLACPAPHTPKETAMTQRHWQASYGSIPKDINPDAYRSVVDLMEQAMKRFADKPAMRCAGQTLTYAQLDRLSRDFAAYLQGKLGVKKGDRIAVMAPNLLAFPIAFLGIIRAGAVQVNVNPLYTPRELEHQLNDAGAATIVVYSGVSATVAEVMAKTGLKTIITVGVGDGSGVVLPSPPVDARLGGAIAFTDALADGAKLQFKAVDVNGDDLLFLQYTGGTTGLSKGAALSHRNLVANTEQFKAFMPDGVRPGEEVIVTAIPLYHIFALMVNFITYFSVGADNWLVPNPRDFDSFLDTLKKARPTVFMGVNTLYAGLVMHPGSKEIDWSSLRLAGGGGAAVIGAVSDKWQALTGTFIREGYGLSETSPVVSFNPAAVQAFTGTTGLPLPSTDIKLLDDEGREVGVGQAGEICVKGPQVMAGYWQQPAANATAFTADGYFRTGDVGTFDAEGFLKIVDRKKDMILVSGFNVFPNEIEAVATGCPGVGECACIGIPDEKSGEAVKLFVVKAPSATVTEADVIAHCRKELTGYKVPKFVRFIEALPKSTVGKILRRELRDVA